ncbi:hypothetical protein HID58_092683, partial [Brassica napus]
THVGLEWLLFLVGWVCYNDPPISFSGNPSATSIDVGACHFAALLSLLSLVPHLLLRYSDFAAFLALKEPNDWASSAGDPSSPTLGGDSGGDYDKEDSADDPIGGNQGFVGPSLLTKESLRRMWKKCGFSRDIEARIPLEEERPWSAPPGWVCLYSLSFLRSHLWFPLPRLLTSYAAKRDVVISQMSPTTICNMVIALVLGTEADVDFEFFEMISQMNFITDETFSISSKARCHLMDGRELSKADVMLVYLILMRSLGPIGIPNRVVIFLFSFVALDVYLADLGSREALASSIMGETPFTTNSRPWENYLNVERVHRSIPRIHAGYYSVAIRLVTIHSALCEYYGTLDKLVNRVLLIGRKFSISWKEARFQGPNSGFLLAGTWNVPLSGTRGSGSFLEAGGNDTEVFFFNSLPLISRFRHRSRGITCALKSTGVAHSHQAPLRQDPVPLIFLSWVLLKPELILNPGWSSEVLTTRGLERVLCWENPGIFEARTLCFEERRECCGADASTLRMRVFLLERTGAS